MTRTRALFVLLFIIPLFSFSQDLRYTSKRVSGNAPTIDGKFTDACWQSANWNNSPFIQMEPYEGKESTQKTSFAVLYDDDNLYVAIKAFDTEPQKINKRLARHDSFEGDLVGIAIDSYEDKRTAFGFIVSAAGVKNDMLFSNDDSQNNDWDPIWDVKVSENSEGWYAEMKIPFSQLRFTKKDQHQWGLEITRMLFRNQEQSFWAPLSKSSAKVVSAFGAMDGIDNIKPKKDIELFPFVLGKASYSEKEEGNPFKTGKEYTGSAGLDGKISITNDLTLNFTLNPDFGQVEADPSEVNLTAFESYFREKRPFFIEGSNIFAFPLTSGDGDGSLSSPFYSRRIGRTPHLYPDLNNGQYAKVPEKTNILGAFKLSGKTRKGTSIGILESFTPKMQATIDTQGNRSQYPVEPFTNYALARVEQDINKGNTVIGGLFTATNRNLNDAIFNELPTAAYTGGANFAHFWKNRTYVMNMRTFFSSIQGSKEAITQLQRSSTHYYQRPDATHISVNTNATSLNGYGGTIDFGKLSGHWNTIHWVTFRSPGLDFNDMGFVQNGDEIQQVSWAGYSVWEPKAFYRSYRLNGNFFTGWNFEGKNTYSGENLSGNIKLKNYYSVFAQIQNNGPRFSTSALRGGPGLKLPGNFHYHCGFETDERKKLIMELFFLQEIGYAHSSRFTLVEYTLTYKPNNSLSLSLAPEFNNSANNLQYIKTFNNQQATQYLMGRLNSRSLSMSTRINFSISPVMTIQYYAQPFLFSGKYSGFKKITQPSAKVYTDRFHEFTGNEVAFNAENNTYSIDSDLNGTRDYTFDNPDFHFLQFRSNLVFRWEYKPGSALYLVWAQGRTTDGRNGDFRFGNYSRELYHKTPQNDFLIKLSYAVIF